MALVVDFHTHVVPSRLPNDRLAKAMSAKVDSKLGEMRRKARSWVRPVASSLHQSQTFLRVLPERLRRPVDELGMLAPLAGLLIESSPKDLSEAMREAHVDYALVIAHPPHLENDTLLEICADHPEFIPVVNIPPGTDRPGQVLRSYAKKGVRVLKIHAAADGEGASSPRYRALLKSASELGLPVILHTGYIRSRIAYKDPEQGKVEHFSSWFETYKDVRFILAHMNLHEPGVALDLAEEHENVFVDTSWQPSEIIGEAVRRLGAGKVLFGTDWPLIGNNIAVGIGRIRDCVETGTISKTDAELVLGKNAQCLLNLPN